MTKAEMEARVQVLMVRQETLENEHVNATTELMSLVQTLEKMEQLENEQ